MPRAATLGMAVCMGLLPGHAGIEAGYALMGELQVLFSVEPFAERGKRQRFALPPLQHPPNPAPFAHSFKSTKKQRGVEDSPQLRLPQSRNRFVGSTSVDVRQKLRRPQTQHRTAR